MKYSTVKNRSQRTSYDVIHKNTRVNKINKNEVKLFYLAFQQGAQDMPANGSSFTPTRLWGKRLELLSVYCHSLNVDDEWNCNVLIDDVAQTGTFTESNSNDKDDPFEFDSGIIYDDSKKLTIKVNTSDCEEWEGILCFRYL